VIILENTIKLHEAKSGDYGEYFSIGLGGGIGLRREQCGNAHCRDKNSAYLIKGSRFFPADELASISVTNTVCGLVHWLFWGEKLLKFFFFFFFL
jgi:hypothetical protein